MNYLNNIVALSLFLVTYIAFSTVTAKNAKSEKDSLTAIINNAKIDISTRLETEIVLEEMKWNMRLSYWDSLATRAIHHKVKKVAASAFNNVGYIYHNKGNMSQALENHTRSLQLRKELDDQEGIAQSLNNIGLVYKNQGDIPRALEFYHNSLKIREEIKDSVGIANSMFNLANIYYQQGEIDKAIEFNKLSLEIRKKLGSQHGIALCLHNIGIIYYRRGDPEVTESEELSRKAGFKKALEYYQQSLAIREKINDKLRIAESLNEIGTVYVQFNQIDSAIQFFEKSLAIQESIDDKEGMAITLNKIALLELDRADLKNAKAHAHKALQLAQMSDAAEAISKITLTLKKVAEIEKDYQTALEMYDLHIQMRDSIKNEETQKAAIRQQTKYEFEKAELLKQQKLKEEIRKGKEKTQRRNNLQYSIIFIAILGIFGLVLALGKIQVSPKFAEGLIFFAFLLLFEFLLVLTDPYIEQITNGEPMYKLLANALLAGIIFPAHGFFEVILKKRLLRKNEL